MLILKGMGMCVYLYVTVHFMNDTTTDKKTKNKK